MGRAPKPPGSRVRRNADQADWQDIVAPSEVPDWPGLESDPPEAQLYWKTVWAELGGMWSEADQMPIFRAAMLHAQVIGTGRKRQFASRLAKIARGIRDASESDSDFLQGIAMDFGFAQADASAAKALADLEDKHGISATSRRRLQWELSKGTGKADPDTAAPGTDRARARRTTSTGNPLEALSG
jgi:hypothetical protein